MESTNSRTQVQSNEVAANERVRDTYMQQFDLGSRSLLELLDSENELFLSAGNLTTTKYLNIFSIYKILATNGTLMSTFDIDDVNEATTVLDKNNFLKTDMKLYKAPSEDAGDINLDNFDVDKIDSNELDPNALLEPNIPVDLKPSSTKAITSKTDTAKTPNNGMGSGFFNPSISAASSKKIAL